MKLIVPKTISDFKSLFDKLHNSGLCYYRGQADASWGITPGLTRNKNIPKDDETLCKLEHKLNDLFFNLASNPRLKELITTNNNCYHESWNYLMVSQHHGLPTRLFDFSNNKFTALEFAVADLGFLDKDGAFFIYENAISIQKNVEDIIFKKPFNNTHEDFFMQVPKYYSAESNILDFGESRKIIQGSKFLYRQTSKLCQCLALDDIHSHHLTKIHISKDLKRSIVDFLIEINEIKFNLYVDKNEMDYRCGILKSDFQQLTKEKIKDFLINPYD